MNVVDISLPNMALAYLLALPPLAIVMWYRLPLLTPMLSALVRMAVQLAFVGLYLTVVFELDRWWLNLLWLTAMIVVADLSVARGCGLRMRRIGPILFIALLAGVLPAMLHFTGVVLARDSMLEAQYAIPLGGMILGNCLRAVIVGLSRFFDGLREGAAAYRLALAQGATVAEAARPFIRAGLDQALAPTVQTLATMGLVSLPGMMTGVILAGADPVRAIKYQIVIALAILAGTAITLLVAFQLALRTAFTPWGLLDEDVFAPGRGRGRRRG